MESSTMNQLVDVMVTYAYTAVEEDELSLRPGDVIRGVERLPGGWWRGELRGKVGLFPDSFVRIMGATHDTNNEVIYRNPRYCRAMYSYQQANPDELSLAVGDVIQVLGEEEEGWWRGQMGSQRGVFPSNFVEPLDPSHIPPPVLPPKPVREQCRVMFPYTAANMDELTLVEGDIVTILSREVPDQGWWLGELRGRKGLFPDNFVALLPHPHVSGSDSTNKKPSRPVKNISTGNKSQPTSMNRKDSNASSKSSTVTGHENVASVRKSLEINDTNITDQNKIKKTTESAESGTDTKGRKPQKPAEAENTVEQKPRKSLEVDGSNKPPVPTKKAGSPVSAILSGIKQKMLAVEQRITSQGQSTDTADGASSSRLSNSGEPVLRSLSPLPSSAPTTATPAPAVPPHAAAHNSATDNFDQVERTAMLNDPRAGRVKAPRRRPPSQSLRDDGSLTNGSPVPPSSEPPTEEEIIKPKTREWEKHKAPWMEELKLNQAKKTSPIAEIGRSKTIATSETNSSEKTEVHHGRLTGSSDKILDSRTVDNDKDMMGSPLEMSQSMNALSSNAIKIETVEEVQTHTENPLDMSKSMISMTSKSSHLETNNKISSNELRTSISSSASVVLRSKVVPSHPTPVLRPSSAQKEDSTIVNNSSVIKHDKNHPANENTSEITTGPRSHASEKDPILDAIHSNGYAMDSSPEQILIAQLNERVANLEKVVEAQEERFSLALSDLKRQLIKETEQRILLQADIQKLERCVTRV